MKENQSLKYRTENFIRSKYYYENSLVYVNLMNIRDGDKLSKFEADITGQRLIELMYQPIKGRFGKAHLLNIHKHIFKDIYPFAGKLRQEDICKDQTMFCKSEFIVENLERTFKMLKSEKYLSEIPIKEFSVRLAVYMSELNIIHPFREGNGRTIREFIRCLALKNKYYIDWSLVNKEELLEAMISSVNKNHENLNECMFRVIKNK